MILLKGSTPALRLIVLLAVCVGALTSCKRQGTDQPVRAAAPDPRIVKNFGEEGSRFCTFQLLYSEATDSEATNPEVAQTKSKLIVATGENQTATATALTQSCAGLGATGKTLCSEKLKNESSYRCVHESMFMTHSRGKPVWECRMPFTVPNDGLTAASSGAEQSAILAENNKLLTVTGKSTDSIQQVIRHAFTQCAEITVEQTETIRNACANAMIEKKMHCRDISLPEPAPSPSPGASPVPRKPRVFY